MDQNKALKQRYYFDKNSNQYPKQLILSPPKQHQLEVEHLDKLLNLSSPKEILDFGSGSGRMTIPYLQKGYNVTAVDVSPKSLANLQLLYHKNKTASWGKLTTHTSIPPNKSFDAIIGSDILHHINMPLTLPKLYRALKDGGILVISEPNGLNILWYIFILLRLPWSIEKGIRQCTILYLNKQFKKAGFRHVHIEGHGLIPTPLPLFVISRRNALSWGNIPILKHFAFRLIARAIK